MSAIDSPRAGGEFPLTAGSARAQSTIAGIVKDTSGAVLPGVTVEATSDALIERTRSVVTDGQGAYKIVDLRPGNYVVTFTVAGFQTIRREGLELPSNFTMTVNADLKIGAVAESITVTGASPVVDVQSNARAAVLPREILDSVPNAHTIQSVGQLVVGVTLTAPDVGGSQAMQQTYFTVRGAGAGQTDRADGRHDPQRPPRRRCHPELPERRGKPGNGLSDRWWRGGFGDRRAEAQPHSERGRESTTDRSSLVFEKGAARQSDNLVPVPAATTASGRWTRSGSTATSMSLRAGRSRRTKLWFFASGARFSR